MHIVRLASASVVAVALSVTLGSVSASADQSAKADGVKAAPAASTESAPAAATFSTLARVKATPMSASELDAVKGQHLHFVTENSKNQQFGPEPFPGGLHLVNRNNTDHWEDLYGDGLVGPGYHGLCTAALNSPNMSIPGQSLATGHGGGC